MTTADVKNIIKNAEEFQSPPPLPLMRDLPPATPFPVNALGKLLGDAAKAIQNYTQAPLAIAGQAVLATATLAVQGHRDVRLPNGQKKPVSSYFLTIAESGERKTACDTEALRAIRAFEEQLRKEYSMLQTVHEVEQDVWKDNRDNIVSEYKESGKDINDAIKDIGFKPLSPPFPMITSPEGTYEGLIKFLDKSRASNGLFASEGGQFIGGHGMTDEAKLRTSTGLSAIWDGEPIKRVRGGEGIQLISGKRLAIHLMCQPDVASILLNDEMLAGQGILSRMLITAPESTAGSRRWRQPADKSRTILDKYNKHINDIMYTPLPLTPGTNNELSPPVITLSKEAINVWIKFHDATEKAMAPNGEYATIKSMANKLPEHAIRLAAVLTLVEDLQASFVDEKNMAAGIELARHYAKEALRLFGASRVSIELQLAKRLYDWLCTSWTEPAVSLPDIYQFSPVTAIRVKEMANKVANILAEHGHLIPISEGTVIKGKRRKQAWLIVRPTKGRA